MARAEKSNEPSMEEILASIRQIIAEEPTGRQAAVPPPPVAVSRAAPLPTPPVEAVQPAARAMPAPIAPKPADAPLPHQSFVPPPAHPVAPIAAPAPLPPDAPAPIEPKPAVAVAPEPQPRAHATVADTSNLSEAIARSMTSPLPVEPAQALSPAPTRAPVTAAPLAPVPLPLPLPQADAMTRPVWRFTRPAAETPPPPAAPAALAVDSRDAHPVKAPIQPEPRAAAPRDLGAFVPSRTDDLRLSPSAAREPAQLAIQPAAVTPAPVIRPTEAPVQPMSISALLPPMVDEPQPLPPPAQAPAPAVAPVVAKAPAPLTVPHPATIVTPAPIAPTALAVTDPAVAPAKVAASAVPMGLAPVRSIEDAVVDLLRPMLRQWLDDNMPRIIEKTLKVELAESLKRTVGGAPKSE